MALETVAARAGVGIGTPVPPLSESGRARRRRLPARGGRPVRRGGSDLLASKPADEALRAWTQNGLQTTLPPSAAWVTPCAPPPRAIPRCSPRPASGSWAHCGCSSKPARLQARCAVTWILGTSCASSTASGTCPTVPNGARTSAGCFDLSLDGLRYGRARRHAAARSLSAAWRPRYGDSFDLNHPLWIHQSAHDNRGAGAWTTH